MNLLKVYVCMLQDRRAFLLGVTFKDSLHFLVVISSELADTEGKIISWLSNDTLWHCMVFDGTLWYIMIFHSTSWFLIVLYVTVWYFMVLDCTVVLLYGFVIFIYITNWYFLVLYGTFSYYLVIFCTSWCVQYFLEKC